MEAVYVRKGIPFSFKTQAEGLFLKGIPCLPVFSFPYAFLPGAHSHFSTNLHPEFLCQAEVLELET